MKTKANFERLNQCQCVWWLENKHTETNKMVFLLLSSFIRSSTTVGVVCLVSRNKVMAEKLPLQLKFRMDVERYLVYLSKCTMKNDFSNSFGNEK